MIEALPSDVDVPGEMLLAGYFVAVPERLTVSGLPRTERLTSASDCLIDRFPDDGCWFGTAQEALAACLPLQLPVDARLYALVVPSEHAGGFVTDIRAAGTDEPVLLAHLDGQGAGETAQEVAEGGQKLGWEVLGYDCGLLHTWLCNDLYEDGRLHLGVDTDERGLLPDRQTALRVAAWANSRRDTKPVTWFPGTLIEWDTPIKSGLDPAISKAPVRFA
ncbi:MULTISPECIES: hypothetical protein [unclassified Streptomyces]|uniref:hypothetical protein n=1 Tax=unclassified Streptomyces TaxID=2593676 RepID=UPI001CB6FC9A|nr:MULTISPECIES: hypothetical protein [unclassified Streptomyces]